MESHGSRLHTCHRSWSANWPGRPDGDLTAERLCGGRRRRGGRRRGGRRRWAGPGWAPERLLRSARRGLASGANRRCPRRSQDNSRWRLFGDRRDHYWCRSGHYQCGWRHRGGRRLRGRDYNSHRYTNHPGVLVGCPRRRPLPLGHPRPCSDDGPGAGQDGQCAYSQQNPRHPTCKSRSRFLFGSRIIRLVFAALRAAASR